MKLALSKRKAKKLAAGTIFYSDTLGMWYLSLYMVVDGKAGPFGMNPHETEEAAIADGNETLKVTDGDWIEIEEDQADAYIEQHAWHRWNPGG
ncbi:hypothetical protein C5Y96_07730 [Blastopirellula marina]|uniref:Uncharacterized protein n=1 Tax=Blastopirellula marina TaxID=124 RepID=A0A2S8FXY1_9BACT|nr:MULTISPECIES: hypothetical protein [Pirellulaceae]PQO37039.1 hypothetical protein C5Y96_07730 [Blastopirellula marina]RCS53754.1 hypothetical protein DTL36_07740 [Bremerella cremea]